MVRDLQKIPPMKSQYITLSSTNRMRVEGSSGTLECRRLDLTGPLSNAISRKMLKVTIKRKRHFRLIKEAPGFGAGPVSDRSRISSVRPLIEVACSNASIASSAYVDEEKEEEQVKEEEQEEGQVEEEKPSVVTATLKLVLTAYSTAIEATLKATLVGQCRLTISKPVRFWFQRLELQYDE